MNTNELIEFLQRDDVFLLEEYLVDVDDFPNDHMETRTREALSQRQELIAVLEYARVRETALEPPTTEDADKNGCVLAICPQSKKWETHSAKYMNDNPSEYPYWTQYPPVPELAPQHIQVP